MQIWSKMETTSKIQNYESKNSLKVSQYLTANMTYKVDLVDIRSGNSAGWPTWIGLVQSVNWAITKTFIDMRSEVLKMYQVKPLQVTAKTSDLRREIASCYAKKRQRNI